MDSPTPTLDPSVAPSVTPAPSPSVTPILVEMVGGGGGAPWWGVPLIAGLFLLVGGLLTYLYARWNEDRKAERQQKAEWNADVLEKGVALLAAGDAITKVGTLVLRRDAVDAMMLVAKEGMPLVEAFRTAHRRFDLVAPVELNEVVKQYGAWSLQLLSAPFQAEGQDLKIRRQAEAGRDLVAGLRSLRGLETPSLPKLEPMGTSISASAGVEVMLNELERAIAERKKAKSAPAGERSSGSGEAGTTSPEP